jgi:hypothetical protein
MVMEEDKVKKNNMNGQGELSKEWGKEERKK